MSSDITNDDLARAAALLKDVPRHSSSVLTTVKSLLERAKNDEFNMSKGISFLDMKNSTMLSYLINMTHLILKKMTGKSIQNDDSIERLVELRTVLEKIKPIDQKLKYQIQKLLTTVATGNVNASDPLHFRANPDNLLSQYGGEDEEDKASQSEDDNSEDKKAKSNVYVPPKISAMYYDGDETEKIRQQNRLEQLKKKAMSSSIMQELRREYDTGPEEIRETSDFHKQKFSEELRERTRYEEEFMLRLPLTKKQKHESKRVTTVSSLSNIAKFDDVSALDMDMSDMQPSKRKRSSSGKFSQKKKKRKSKGFKRKRH